MLQGAKASPGTELFCLVLALLMVGGCRPAPSSPRDSASSIEAASTAPSFRPEAIGAAFVGKPWTSHVSVVDLDGDHLADVLACDDRLNAVVWLRQQSSGGFEEHVLATALAGVVRTEAVDIDRDGDVDLLVACMGELFPNNEKIGSVVVLENNGLQSFTKRVIASNIARVTDVRAGDLDGDGRLDLAVAQFGYDQGEVRWMRNLGSWNFESRTLLSLSGTINVCVADMNGDGNLDLVAVVSQQWEEIYLFENNGRGEFTNKKVFGSTNEDFGSSGISLCDLNRDGKMDILYTNGDGFAFADPGKRPWHGVQWLENIGNSYFRFHRIGDMAGAFSPVGVDLEGRGVMDVVCVSGFNDWKNPKSVSLAVFRNDGKMNFTLEPIAGSPTQLVTCAVGDLDGSGNPSIATGGFNAYPPFDQMSRITLWKRSDASSTGTFPVSR